MIELEVSKYVKICIEEPNELLELMAGDDKVKLISSLSCHDKVIEHVVNQISRLHGCTDEGNSGWSSGVTGTAPLDIARMTIAKSSSQLAKDTIEELQRKLVHQEEQANKWCDKYHAVKSVEY